MNFLLILLLSVWCCIPYSIMSAKLRGYSADTDVLTYNGWRNVLDISKSDKLMVMDIQTRKIGYEHPVSVQRRKYSGKMISVKRRSVDLLLAPQQEMAVTDQRGLIGGGKLQILPMDQMVQSTYFIPCGGVFQPTLREFTEVEMYLIGLYVSEGHVSECRQGIGISQILGVKRSEMEKVVRQQFTVSRSYEKSFFVRTGAEFVKRIVGECREGKYVKRLGSGLLNNQGLSRLYSAMMLGDGTSYIDEHLDQMREKYVTVSNGLVDGFQELCAKLGMESSVCTRPPKTSVPLEGGRRITGTVPCHLVAALKSKFKTVYPKKHWTQKRYSGVVTAIGVPSGCVYVRRDHKTAWCGGVA